MPVRRERRFIMAAMTGSSGWRPSIRTSNRPHARPLRPRPSITSRSASSGSRVSACRNSRVSPRAALAPAFIWEPRPRAATINRSHSGRASAAVRSWLAPSATMTSAPRARKADRACRVAAMPASSLSTGTMIDKRIVLSRAGGRDAVETEPAEARDLQRRVAQIEPGHQAEEIDLDAFDPGELGPDEAVDAHLEAGPAGGGADEGSVGTEVAADSLRRHRDRKLGRGAQHGRGERIAVGARPDPVGAIVCIAVALHRRFDLGDRLRGDFTADIGDQSWGAAEPEGVRRMQIDADRLAEAHHVVTRIRGCIRRLGHDTGM